MEGQFLDDSIEAKVALEELRSIRQMISNSLAITTWKEFRGVFEWKTKDGRRLLLKDMADGHIENTIKFLERKEDWYEWKGEIHVFKRELEYRKNNNITVGR